MYDLKNIILTFSLSTSYMIQKSKIDLDNKD